MTTATPKKTFKMKAITTEKRNGGSPHSETILALKGTYNRFGIGAVPEGKSGRKVFQGSLIPGPWHYSFQLAAVLDDCGGTDFSNDIEVEAGTKLEIDGINYVVVVDRGQWIELEKK